MWLKVFALMVSMGLVVAPAAHTQPVTLVTLGDSLTAGEGDDGVGGGYPARLLALLAPGHPGSTLTNLGVSGYTSDDLVNLELGPAVTALNAAPPGNFKLALVWIGSNDLVQLYSWICDSWAPPNDFPACEGATLAVYSSNITTILNTLEGAGAEVVIALLDDQSRRPGLADPALRLPVFPTISDIDVARMSTQVSLYNADIAGQVTSHGAASADFFSTTLFENWATLATDGIHPNGAGYDAIATIWHQALNGAFWNPIFSDGFE